jgi:hypothetical protein
MTAMNGNAYGLDAAFEVDAREGYRPTVTDTASGITARPYSCGNFGDSFLVAIDEEARDWLQGFLPDTHRAPLVGLYEVDACDWIPELDLDGETLLEDDALAEIRGLAAFVEWIGDEPSAAITYLRFSRRHDLPFGAPELSDSERIGA